MPRLPRFSIPWPRTLLWRTFLLIVLLIGLSLFAWFQIYNHYALRPRSNQAAQLVVSVVNLTRSALLASDENRRVALVRELASLEGIRILPAEPDDIITPMSDNEFMQTLMVEVRRSLGGYTRFSRSLHDQPGFYVSFRVDEDAPEDEYWVMIPTDRIQHATVAGWIGWSVAAGLMSLFGAYLLVLGVTRPLKALENAARAVGRDEQPPQLPEAGAREITEVSRAFNQMSRDLAMLASDRALILAGVSHDLRTPLARLRLGIELSGVGSEDLAAMCADIDDMDRIINQFLDFARDTQAEAAQDTDLSQLIQAAAQPFLRRGAKVDLSMVSAHLHCDTRQLALRRALTNLIDNALKYGAGSGVEIFVRTEARLVAIEVADRGPGIPPEHIERLKRPFTRLDVARTNVQGSGLGMAIVERIARLHAGTFDLAPRPGGGLSATIRLPRYG